MQVYDSHNEDGGCNITNNNTCVEHVPPIFQVGTSVNNQTLVDDLQEEMETEVYVMIS